MANSTISALTSATTPLAGTETLPVVQSGSTKQVSVANLTYGRDVSTRSILVRSDSGPTTYYGTILHDAVTTGANIYDVTSASGGGHVFRRGGSTLVSIDAGGNIIPAVAGKGVNFTANTPASGMTSQNLTWYEEGTWTPALLIAGGNTGITYTSQSGRYTRIGRMVEVECSVVLSSKGARTGAVRVGGLPFTPAIDILPATVVPTGTWVGLIVGGNIQAYISGTAVYLLLGTLTGTGSLTDANLSNTSAFTFTATFSV